MSLYLVMIRKSLGNIARYWSFFGRKPLIDKIYCTLREFEHQMEKVRQNYLLDLEEYRKLPKQRKGELDEQLIKMLQDREGFINVAQLYYLMFKESIIESKLYMWGMANQGRLAHRLSDIKDGDLVNPEKYRLLQAYLGSKKELEQQELNLQQELLNGAGGKPKSQLL